MIANDGFQRGLAEVLARRASAAQAAGRKEEEVGILPVTKTHPVEAVRLAWEAGFRAVGENRVQEAVEKMAQAGSPVGMGWELIGHLQGNKARAAVEHFARIQSVDTGKLAERLDRVAGEMGRTVRILLEVNAGDDPGKYGVSCAEAPALLEQVLGLPRLRVEGLMTVAPLEGGMEAARRSFALLRETRDGLEARFGVCLPELSMGMTGDLEAAVAEGSTLLRIGSALFGAR